jgi:hypothetical protein
MCSLTQGTPGPRRTVAEIRKLPGAGKADALFGTPDIIAIVEGDDLRAMEGVNDRIVESPGVRDTDTPVARWIP